MAGFLSNPQYEPPVETPQQAALGAVQSGQSALSARLKRAIDVGEAAKKGIFVDSAAGGGQQVADSIARTRAARMQSDIYGAANNAVDEGAPAIDEAIRSSRPTAGLLAPDQGVGGGPTPQPTARPGGMGPMGVPAVAAGQSALTDNLTRALGGNQPPAGGGGAPGMAGPAAVPPGHPPIPRAPIPGAIQTDPRILNGAPPRINTVVDARAGQAALAQAGQGAQSGQGGQAGQPAAGLLASRPIDRIQMPQAPQIPGPSEYLAQEGIPDAINLGGGGKFVPAVELAPEAYKGNVQAQVLASRLGYGLANRQLTGEYGLQRAATTAQMHEQTWFNELPAKYQQFADEQAIRHGDRLDEIQEQIKGHIRAGRALQQIRGDNPTTLQVQSIRRTAVNTYASMADGDPERAVELAHQNPDWGRLSKYITDDDLRGEVETMNTGAIAKGAQGAYQSGAAGTPEAAVKATTGIRKAAGAGGGSKLPQLKLGDLQAASTDPDYAKYLESQGYDPDAWTSKKK